MIGVRTVADEQEVFFKLLRRLVGVFMFRRFAGEAQAGDQKFEKVRDRLRRR